MSATNAGSPSTADNALSPRSGMNAEGASLAASEQTANSPVQSPCEPASPASPAMTPAPASPDATDGDGLVYGEPNTQPRDYQGLINKLLLVKTASDMTATISEAELEQLVYDAREIFMAEQAFLDLVAPIKVCGDIHGQFTDLIRLFDMCGYPPNQKYLFMGDLVDRGPQSLEVISLLFAYKCTYPSRFFVLRGNHEATNVNRVYGFYDETRRRYSVALWWLFNEAFDCMPLAALIQQKILCMHGGISTHLRSWEQIRRIERPTSVPDEGLITDLVWADPSAVYPGWRPSTRGISFTFGQDILNEFCHRMNIDLVARAHQVVQDGYSVFGEERNLVTVFSAPNYCGQFTNAGAVMGVDQELMCTFEIIEPKLQTSPSIDDMLAASTKLHPPSPAAAASPDAASPETSSP